MRVEVATAPERDRMIDALRAGSIGCVILGHWLVTALVVDRSGVRIASPLAAMPWLAAVTWALQVLALFFFVGGYANSRSLGSARAAGRRYRAWVAGRARRLGRPIVVLLVVWVAAAGVAAAVGVPVAILRTVGLLVVQPLWFVVVYLLVTALTPVALAAYQRLGLWAAAMSGLVVGVADLAQIGPGALRSPGGLRWASVVFAWLVAYLLGIAWADGGLRSGRAALGLVVIGGAVAAVLIGRGGYPASMVGVTGAARSNLNPPSLLVPAVSCVQVGVVLLVRDRLARSLRRPRVWAVTVLMNRSAMTLFLWHQTALVLVTLALVPASLTSWGAVPGLHTAPSAAAWVGARLGWVPVFAGALAVLWASFRRFEQGLSAQGGEPAEPPQHEQPADDALRHGDPHAGPGRPRVLGGLAGELAGPPVGQQRGAGPRE